MKDSMFEESTHHLLSVLDKDITAFLKKFSEILDLELTNKGEENLSEAQKFVSYAKLDLISAKLLYENKVYPTAVYHLQQAVEKFVKAYVVAFFGIRKKELVNYVKHDSPKAFVKLIKRYKNFIKQTLVIIRKFYNSGQIPEISDDNIRQFEKYIGKNKAQIAKLNSDEIKVILNIATKIKEALKNKETTDTLIQALIKLKDMEFWSIYDENVKTESFNLINRILENPRNLEAILTFTSDFLTLYLISIISYPHATISRYPNKSVSLEEYERTGIVQQFKEILILVEDISDPCELFKG